jgi:hypothetical protein
MKTVLNGFLILALTACSSGGSRGVSTGGAGGDDGSDGGTGGSSTPTGGTGTGGSKSSTPDAAADTGGSTGSTGGASGGAGEGGAQADAGSAGEGGGTATGGSGGAGGSSGNLMGWYEAEAIPPNDKAPKSEVHVNPASACKTMPPTPGDNCQSGGGEVTWITEGRQGWLQFNQVAAPSDGMYDVTWWYHCGNNDNFGDKHCGGQTDPPTTAAGCRPHNIIVNGTELQGTYHFPCFAGSFGIIRAATTALPLKAGMNTIKVYPKSRDAADMDALQVSPLGMGTKPLIKSNNVSGVN